MPEPTPTPSTYLDNAAHQRVEQLIAHVYTTVHGPEAWTHKPFHLRSSIVRFAIDQVDAGLTAVLIHTQHDGTTHHLPAADILTALAANGRGTA